MKCFSIKQKILDIWQWILEDPKCIIRFSVLFTCLIIVIFQLSECFSKLTRPPIATISHFELNDTLSYPAVTFCRMPAYNITLLNEYGLSFHPGVDNFWKYFNFKNVTLTELFNKTTFSSKDFFVQWGLDGYPHNTKIVSHLHFERGQCHTILPLVVTKYAWKKVGYSILLKHDLIDMDSDPMYPYETEPGWDMFIHEPSDIFTENRMQTSGRVEYMYINVNEEVEVKLAVQQYSMMEDRDNTCTHNTEYSATKCGEICRWRQVTDAVKCSGPWMPAIKMPECNTLNTTLALIHNYTNLKERDDSFCNCDQPCTSNIYSAFVMKRKEFAPFPSLYSQIYLYFTSRMVTVNEERPGYDLSQFIADMGGSLGFLLGLSVLGLIGILEKIAVLILSRCPKRKKSTATTEETTSTVETPYPLKQNSIKY